ncbi:hypothetical protein BJ138DRAFT_311906 [Hygrophoropsis aurantiaca]|uniref:Uncharacterized protein n=1 Tax=Hygrophoropsis aurantiaca TaxID=72124 RepID=A0ACB8AP62_9AGAM|nr:hypothetical protein BJ138DRAFT_311906 [Hygrophoropsis aurantiaca]
MSGEKTFLAKLRSPFRSTLDTIEDLSIARQSRGIDSASGSRVSSVYLSDDSSAHGFVVVPEFDDTSASTELENSSSIRSNPTQEFSTPSLDSFSNGHSSYFSDFSRQATTGTSPDIEPGYMLAVEASEIPEADHCHLDQRLGVAYDHIRSLQSPVSPCLRNPASDEPGTLRKQLGLPQHSVINHVPSVMPHLPNPHVRPLKSPPSSYYPVPDAETSRPPTPPSCHYNVRSASRFPQSSKPSLHINTNVRSSLDQADIIPKSSRLVHSTKHGSHNVNMPWHLVRNIPAEPASSPSVAVHVASLSPSQCMHKRNATKLVKRKSVNVSTRVSESSLTSSPSIDTRLNEKTSLNSQAPRTGVREQPGAVIIGKEKIIPPIRPPSPLRLDIVSSSLLQPTSCGTIDALILKNHFTRHLTMLLPLCRCILPVHTG